jgi:hypothetical protein
MRLSQLIDAFAPVRSDDAAGVTIDVMTGVVAGLAFVLAVLILASSLKEPHAAPMPTEIGQQTITQG